ncbi:MAG: cyclase family protein [Cyclobacteriaceae bacterium]|nr:cyclase family protein [Cyclobacteriaceae bacterium]
MKITLSYNNLKYSCDLNKPIDISIPLKNGDDNPNCFWADPVKFETIKVGDFVGSVKEGGSVNYQKVILTPHGNGTHTECYGHISADNAGHINNCLKTFHSIAKLITLPVSKMINGDEFISFDSFKTEIGNNIPEAVIIRTSPNNSDKLNRQYSGTNPPYLDSRITKFLCDTGVNHLLVDIPSIDKEEDGGALKAHKNFWGFNKMPRKHSTITELVYINNHIKDGNYLLNLQIPSILLDAVPSKPVLYQIVLI